MGKNLIQQKRGKGSPTFKAPSFRYIGEVKYGRYTKDTINGEIINIKKSQGHSSPIAQIRYDNGEENLIQAPEGVKIHESIQAGDNASLKFGNIIPLKNIPEGTSIYNIENQPGDGGKFVRSSGTFAKIVTKTHDSIVVLLPSTKRKSFSPDCRATIGVISGGGRTEKPFLKAGNKYFKMKAKNKLWPKVSGISMNAVAHPFGGTSSHVKGRPRQSSRNAPPGRKVGMIAPRRTGRKKG